MIGKRQNSAETIDLDELSKMLLHMPDNLLGKRDRALFLMGIAGAFGAILAGNHVDSLEIQSFGHWRDLDATKDYVKQGANSCRSGRKHWRFK